jgi:hypothetical protein
MLQPVKAIITNWERLSQLLPNEQREQLGKLLLSRLEAGWGSIEIEFKDGHIERFREITSIPARREKPVTLKTYAGN